MLNIGRDIHPLSDFKRKTGDFIELMKNTGRPLVLTLNGRPELVVQDAVSYQLLIDRLEECESELQMDRGKVEVMRPRGVSLGDQRKRSSEL